MSIHDLRSFIDTVRAAGDMHEIRRAVDPVRELGAVLSACERAGKAAFFHAVKGHDVNVVGSLLSSPRRIALALIKRRETLLDPLVQTLGAAAAAVKVCGACGNYDSQDPCSICAAGVSRRSRDRAWSSRASASRTAPSARASRAF